MRTRTHPSRSFTGRIPFNRQVTQSRGRGSVSDIVKSTTEVPDAPLSERSYRHTAIRAAEYSQAGTSNPMADLTLRRNTK
jgi:hypothetical protein